MQTKSELLRALAAKGVMVDVDIPDEILHDLAEEYGLPGEFSRWWYCGDVNLEYGGTFIDLTPWSYGYVDAVRVTDLDSGCGFRGACLIERVSIQVGDTERTKAALKCSGVGASGPFVYDSKDDVRARVAEALLNYMGGDVMESEVVQTEPDGPMRFEGWRAKRLRGTGLRAYVESVWLEE